MNTNVRAQIPRFSFFRWLLCVFTFNHFDNGVARDDVGVWRCKKCGIRAEELS